MPCANGPFKKDLKHFTMTTSWHIKKRFYLLWMWSLFCRRNFWKTDRVGISVTADHFTSVTARSLWLHFLFMEQNKAGSLFQTEFSPRAQTHSKWNFIWGELLSPWQHSDSTLRRVFNSPHRRKVQLLLTLLRDYYIRVSNRVYYIFN